MTTLVRRLTKVLLPVLLISTGCADARDSSEYQILKSELVSLVDTYGPFGDLETKFRNVDAVHKELLAELSSELSNDSQIEQVINRIGFEACKQFTTIGQKTLASSDSEGQAYFDEIAAQLELHVKVLGRLNPFPDSEDYSNLRAYQTKLKDTDCVREGSIEFYKTCETFDRIQLSKYPNAFIGKCVRGKVRIAQYDSNTGPCAFQGYLDGGYEVRAQFGATLVPENHSTVSDCSYMSELVEDSYVTFWGVGIGAFSYSTVFGGTQIVPAFKLLSYTKQG